MRQQPRFFISVRILLVFIAALVLGFTETARATITFTVDDASVSAFDTSPSPHVIYGGVAGSAVGGCATFTSGTAATCDNCVAPTNTTGDDALLACNKRRIMYSGRLHLRVSSDQKDGVPILVFNGTTTSKVPASSGFSEVSVGKGTTGDIYVDWATVCQLVGASSQCVPTTDQNTGSFKVGIDNGNDGALTDGTDDSTIVTITVRDGIERHGGTVPDASVSRVCGDTSQVGLCNFEVISGDKKFELKDPTGNASFPVANNTSFKFIRVLFEKRTDPATPVFSQITCGSDYADLEVGGASPNLTLTPARVVGLENDAVYDVKVASVDAAGNTGYYTGQNEDARLSADESCPASALNGSAYECHTARPSEVVGILSEPVNCFVATAAYGSPMEQEVSTFRAFRERFLAHNAAGRAFIRWYYVEGPKMASFIAGHETRRSIARAALALPLAFSKFALREGGYAAVGLLALIFGAPIALGTFAWARRRKRGLRA